MSNNEIIKCQVKNCRFSNSHVTRGHLCGKCKKYGHGEMECYSFEKRNDLKQYYSDKIPENKRCRFGGCEYKKYHTSDAHHCELCLGRSHSKETCSKNPNNQPILNIELKCPICKTDNVIPKNQNKIYGLSDTCAVCMNNTVDVFLPNCGHACLCQTCVAFLDKNSQVKTNYDPFMDIRSETILKIEKYDLEKIKSQLKSFPSYVAIYEGMGCCTVVRRLDSTSEIFGLFIHADDHYNPVKIQKNEDFVKGYYKVEDESMYHDWNPNQGEPSVL
jgi:hypothetical protein